MNGATAYHGRLRHIQALTVGWMLVAAASSAAADLRPGAASLECERQKPRGDPRWWSFRQDVGGIPGRCWYPGKPGKSKTELHWGRRISGAERRSGSSSTLDAPAEDARSADHEKANTCCWPPLEPEPTPPPPAEPSFRQRWNDLLNDMAEPVMRWRGQLKDQHRFGE
jgi:hypothetical protein